MKDELEQWYAAPDPWKYTETLDDIRRKHYILHTLSFFGPFKRALDLGAGEGWITQDLPASTKHGFELSDMAASRFPSNVLRANDGKYDLVLATGVLYKHYDWESFSRMIRAHASDIVLTCNIKEWEVPAAIQGIGEQLLEMEFPYRQYVQKLRVFRL